MSGTDEAIAIGHVVQRLTASYADVPPDMIVSVVNNARARFDNSPVREFVPLFVERRARIELGQLASTVSKAAKGVTAT